MIGHMFATMNEMLDAIKLRYPEASGHEQSACLEQISKLKAMSDEIIEHWLGFEEKLAEISKMLPAVPAIASELPEAAAAASETAAAYWPGEQQLKEGHGYSAAMCNSHDLDIPDNVVGFMDKGQGYYKLFMFPEAANQFQTTIAEAPECNLARLFLGMSQMHLRNWNEAQRHFQLLVALSDFPKWLALGYNALGCIQAIRMNMAQAEELFRKAHETYPEFKDSLSNLHSCRQSAAGQLSLFFGSTELIYL